MGRTKFNLYGKCGFRHAAPTGKSCSAGDSEQLVGQDNGKKLQGEQDPGCEGPDVHGSPSDSQKAVAIKTRVGKIETEMTAMDGKLDIIIASMKKPALPESCGEDLVEEWTKDISEAWEDVKTRGRARVNRRDMHYGCENYKSVYDPVNKSKLDSMIGKELKEGYFKIVPEKPTCIHSMGAVPKPDGGIRPITDCSMPRDISVNNYCSDINEEFQYKSVDNVLSMLQEGDYIAVVDIKSAYRAVPIFPDHRRYLGLKWEIDGKVVYIEDSRLCFGLCLGPSYFDKISGFLYNILADIYNIQAVNY